MNTEVLNVDIYFNAAVPVMSENGCQTFQAYVAIY